MRKLLLLTFCIPFCILFSSGSVFGDTDPYGTDDSYGVEDSCTAEMPSSVVTANQTLKTAVTQTATLISARVSRIISPNPGTAPKSKTQMTQLSYYPGYNNKKMSGLSAGDAPPKFGLWGNASYTETDIDSVIADSESDFMLVMVGVDYKPTANTVVGVALGYEDSDSDTYFNRGEKENDGFTLAPYFAYLINENISISLSGGYSWVSYDQFRTDADNNKVSSDLDSNRWFVSSAVNIYKNYGALNLNIYVGYTISEESMDSFTESDGTRVDSEDINLNTLNVGMETSYFLGAWEPYVRLGYSYDTEYDAFSEEDYDKDYIRAGLGARISFSQNLTGDLLFSTTIDHEDQSEESYMFNIRYEF